MAGTHTDQREDQDQRTLPEHPWQTVVWDDPVNLMSYVTYVFQSHFGFEREHAERLMLQVHESGSAVVAEGAREVPGVDWRLTLLGDSRDRPYLDRLKAIAAEDGTRGSIDFVERVAPSELVGLFDAHDIYLFPSYYEPFSLTLIHALAAGIPTVASATGGNVEIVSEGETGLLFAKGDSGDLARAVVRLQADPALAQRVGAAGAQVARRYSTEAMIAAMEAHLSSVAAAPVA